LIEAAVALAITFCRRDVRGIHTFLRVRRTLRWIGVRIPPLYTEMSENKLSMYTVVRHFTFHIISLSILDKV